MQLGPVGAQVADELGIDDGARTRIGEPIGGTGWSSRLPVAQLAVDSVALSSLAIDLFAHRRSDAIRVDAARVAASFGSERLLRLDGERPSAWAPLSGFWPTADGWVRTHANYPHHDRALRDLLRLDPDAGPDAAAAVLRDSSALDLEARAAEARAVVGAVRSEDAWREHPHGRRLAASPLVEVVRYGDAAARRRDASGAPLAGVRVLDLTRVIAGPVAARDLALVGADVLRIDSPRLPEMGWIHLDTGQAKRSALLDLDDPRDRECFDELLARADVLVTGYRPGALDRFGLDAAHLAERHPGLVTAAVSAWGWRGPWAQRRGFDSIVQAVSGVAAAESPDDATPGALPVQALDHSTGHFLAAAIVVALAEQRRIGGSIDVRMSLARVARALVDAPRDAPPGKQRGGPAPAIERVIGRPGLHTLAYAPPVLAFADAPADYARAGDAWGVDAATWDG